MLPRNTLGHPSFRKSATIKDNHQIIFHPRYIDSRVLSLYIRLSVAYKQVATGEKRLTYEGPFTLPHLDADSLNLFSDFHLYRPLEPRFEPNSLGDYSLHPHPLRVTLLIKSPCPLFLYSKN
jgi:hypothetical protein